MLANICVMIYQLSVGEKTRQIRQTDTHFMGLKLLPFESISA